ncbi:MAG: hypothetical protein NTNFB02_35110 [Nitrospira sp.]
MQIRLRLSEQISSAVRQQAGQRRVHVHDYVRHLVERGLLVDVITLTRVAQGQSMPIAQQVLESILETRNLLRSLMAVRDQQTVSRAQAEAKREADLCYAKGAHHASPAA